jgi:hypothetical protein
VSAHKDWGGGGWGCDLAVGALVLALGVVIGLALLAGSLW